MPSVADIHPWLDRCEAELIHPAVVERRLRDAGWPSLEASGAVVSYRRRFNEHALGYSALLISTGVAALGFGSAGHILISGLAQPVDRRALTTWLTVLICSLPFAVWAHLWARAVDRDDPVAVWSEPRRILAQILLWAAAIVGIGRLMVYVGQVVGVLVGSRRALGNSLLAGALNVALVIAITAPLWAWAHRFLHCFDAEDPTVPVIHHRRSAAPRS